MDILTQTSNFPIPMISLGITEGVFRFAIDHERARGNVLTTGIDIVSAGCLLLAAFTVSISNALLYVWLVVTFVAASCYHGLCAQFIRATENTKLFAV